MSTIKKAKLVQDSVYPGMYRIHWADGVVSDMVNYTRANDAVKRFEETAPRIERRMAGKRN